MSDEAERAVEELDRVAHDLIDDLERLIPLALRGGEDSARRYLRVWRELVRHCMVLAREAAPGAVVETDAGEVVFLDAKGVAAPAGRELIDYLALSAPFSPWVTRFGPGRGAAIFLLSEVRKAIPGLGPLPPPEGAAALAHWDVDASDFARFARHVWMELQHEETPLEGIANVFDLTNTNLGRLFGVKRQAVAQWLEGGIPPARQPKVLAVAQIADLLDRNLIGSRIPAVARTPSAAYGGRTMLDMIAEDRHEDLLESVRASFDWASTA